MAFINVSQLVKVDVSTYEETSMDTVFDRLGEDLDECGITDPEIECDDGLDFQKFKKELGGAFMDAVNEYIPNLKDILLKYNMIQAGHHFYTPQYYNFEGDSFDINIECTNVPENIVEWLENKGLTELVIQYIKEERQSSCDGYMSFEPLMLSEVERNDYCVMRAILKKEDIFDTMRDALLSITEEGYNEIVWQCSHPHYTKWEKDENGKRTHEVKYKLDYDNKILVPYVESDDSSNS